MILGEVLGKKMVSDFWMSKKTKSRRTPPGGGGHQDRLTVTTPRARGGARKCDHYGKTLNKRGLLKMSFFD